MASAALFKARSCFVSGSEAMVCSVLFDSFGVLQAVPITIKHAIVK
jgi:hypothetical protein